MTDMQVFQRIPYFRVEDDENSRVVKAVEEEREGSKKVGG
jgi:hypothetical protein